MKKNLVLIIIIFLVDLVIYNFQTRQCNEINYLGITLALMMQLNALWIFYKTGFTKTKFLGVNYSKSDLIIICLIHFFGSFYIFWEAGKGGYLAGGTYHCESQSIQLIEFFGWLKSVFMS